MATVTVYNVKVYNVTADEWTISRRMATPEGAAKMRGEIIKGTGFEIQTHMLEPGEEWTSREFNPHPRSGIQTKVTT